MEEAENNSNLENQSVSNSKFKIHPRRLKIALLGAASLVLLPLIPGIFGGLRNLVLRVAAEKIDDWSFGGELSLSGLFSQFLYIGITEKLIAGAIILVLLLGLLFPILRLIKAYITNLDTIGYQTRKSSIKHRLWIAVPSVIILTTIYALVLLLSYIGFNRLLNFAGSNYRVLEILSGLSLVVAVLIVLQFIYGVFRWIFSRGDIIKKKNGRGSIYFSFYYLPLLIILWVPNILVSTYAVGGSGMPGAGGGGISSFPSVSNSMGVAADNIGLAVGGANDVNNFRENIKNGYLPIPSDITHEGLYYDYKFDTGVQKPCEDLFCPSFTTAISPDPFSGENEYFLSVGLNSGIKQSDFKRKKLNLVIVMDISGSMGSSFNQYYYDRFRTDIEQQEEFDSRSKMQIANKSVVALLKHLEPEDSYGMVLFESQAFVAKPLRSVSDTNMAAISDHILAVGPQGGTNMEAGYVAGTGLFDGVKNADPAEYENRIIFLTDAMPNTGMLSEAGLLGLSKQNADKGIYTTFIGVGVDFNTELIESITKTKGSNYYSVHSGEEFTHRMDDGFDYMVTPLVFDLALDLDAPGYNIKAVYGSPEANLATGELMRVNTLFPSERTDDETRGGLVLLHLEKVSQDNTINLGVSYQDRTGNKFNVNDKVEFQLSDTEYYDNSGIHKGVVLSRYVNAVRDWLSEQNARAPKPTIEISIVRYSEEGIPVMDILTELGRWERTSNELLVSDDYAPILERLREYINQEMQSIGDNALEQEVEILNRILLGR